MQLENDKGRFNERFVWQIGTQMENADSKDEISPSERISILIAGLEDWRGRTVAQLRQVIHEADPDIAEDWKWDTAVWTHNGLVCAAGVFKDHVKINFFKGASLEDPKGLFNAGLDAKATRAIDFNEGDRVDTPALKNLICAAVAINLAAGRKK
jgi:hypothetical protein